MQALVVYESMYGNTHLIADAVADGLRVDGEATVVAVRDLAPSMLDGVDLLVVGSPTHVHGMTRDSTRAAAVEAAQKPGSALVLDDELDPHAPGLREWFDSVESLPPAAAAFDTRIDVAAALTGRASKGIARRLRKHGASLVAAPTSFLVAKDSRLEPDETLRAREWGQRLGESLRTPARA
jgi:hypothetical protein